MDWLIVRVLVVQDQVQLEVVARDGIETPT
jgi:hypothetical protein